MDAVNKKNEKIDVTELVSEVVAPKILSKMDILAAGKKLKKELVEVPEWGGSVWIRELTAVERDNFDLGTLESGSAKGMRVRSLIGTVVDENEKPLFTDLDFDDLMKMSGVVVDRLAGVAMRLSSIGRSSKAAEAKNSVTVPNEGSSSDSAKN